MKAMRFEVRLLLMAVVTALSGATGVAQQPPGPPTTLMSVSAEANRADAAGW